jgi:hypothetical protein
VTFEDGRTAFIRAELKVRAVEALFRATERAPRAIHA